MHGRRPPQARDEPGTGAGSEPVPAAEPTAVPREEALFALTVAYRQVTEIVRGRPDTELIGPTRCTGWSVLDVLYHVLLDAQRALIALATPDDRIADTDYISYWRSFPAARVGANEHARAVRIAASAFRPTTLVQLWQETSAAAVHAARAADADLRVSTQQHVLALPDLLVTLAVEACVHALDLTVRVTDVPAPDPAPLALVRRTLDGLLGAGVTRPDWPDEEYALKGTGRLDLTGTEREMLGAAASQFPLFA